MKTIKLHHLLNPLAYQKIKISFYKYISEKGSKCGTQICEIMTKSSNFNSLNSDMI